MVVEFKATYENGILTLQRNKYIEDGWYIENFNGNWKLFEIPQYGGEVQFVGKYPSFEAAYKQAIELT